MVKEIEGWYRAGLRAEDSKNLGLPEIKDSNNTTKEDFNRLIPKEIKFRVIFMEKILKKYDIEIAEEKNRSLKYFLNKYRLRE